MSLYFIKNSQSKLRKSILKTEDLKISNSQQNKGLLLIRRDNLFFDSSSLKNFYIFFFNKLISFFLSKILKNILNRKNKKKIFFYFLSFYKYLNFFFFKQNNFSSKKFFIKKKIFYLKSKNFPLFNKITRFKRSIPILKKKKIDFLRKYIKKKKIFFKKNKQLIFNKKFLKAFSKNQVENELIHSFMDLLGVNKLLKKVKKRFFIFSHFENLARKKFASVFHRRYHYLFHYKRFAITYKVRKKVKNYHKKKKRILFNFYRKWRRNSLDFYTFFLRKGKHFYVKKHRRSRRVWKVCYPFSREEPETIFFAKFLKFNLDLIKKNSFKSRKIKIKKNKKNFIFFRKKKSRRKLIKLSKSFRVNVLSEYLINFCEKLRKRRLDKKNFVNIFFAYNNSYRRNKNISYFLNFKKKFFFIQNLKKFNRIKNFKRLSFSFHFYTFFLKKISWKKRKFNKKFLIFFFSQVLFKRIPIFFKLKSFFIKFAFIKKKRLVKRFKIRLRGRKRRKYFILLWEKRKKKKILKFWFLRKILRLFIVLLFLRFLKKNINLKKILLFKNANIMNTLKLFNFRFISYIFSNFSIFYFKKNRDLNDSLVSKKINNKIFYLLKKN